MCGDSRVRIFVLFGVQDHSGGRMSLGEDHLGEKIGEKKDISAS